MGAGHFFLLEMQHATSTLSLGYWYRYYLLSCMEISLNATITIVLWYFLQQANVTTFTVPIMSNGTTNDDAAATPMIPTIK